MANLSIKKEEYVAKIIHDLQTPINAQIAALKSFLSTSEQKISQEEKDLIELTLNSCNYMQSLIDIFNSVHKLNYESIKLNYEKFDFKKLVDSLLDELKILIKYYELNVNFKNDETIIINADKLQIKRVLENLISNSINYAFKNSTIELGFVKTGNFLTFEVKNNSPYIESQTLKEIFQKYKTCASLYNKSGVGLGLYLSSEIIQAHNGSMIAKSYQDNVNIFGFRVPID